MAGFKPGNKGNQGKGVKFPKDSSVFKGSTKKKKKRTSAKVRKS